MKFLNYLLNEKYIMLVTFKYNTTRLHHKDDAFPIFMNPDSSDYREVFKNTSGSRHVRFIIDLNKKNVYVWHSGKAMHDEIVDELTKGKFPLSKNYAYGIGQLQGNKLDIEGFYQEEWKLSPSYDYTWAKTFFINPQDMLKQMAWNEE